ncbi:MAG: hypothetical protein HOH13_02165 [Crocinitomicaceae bacterium]|nr:hypothetical protein [Crocinitomicaceae bacterium]
MKEVHFPYVKGLIMICLLTFHFTCTYFYTAPDTFNSVKMEIISARYINPFFHQYWALFAPNLPDYNVVIEVSEKEGVWRNISHEILENHYSYRITEKGRLALAFTGIARWATWECAVGRVNEKDPEKYQHILKDLCRGYLRMNPTDDLRIRLTKYDLYSAKEGEFIF